VLDWYRHEVVAAGKQPLALMFVAFVVTFLFIRFSVRMIRAGVRWWPDNVAPGGLHVHHVVFGVLLMIIAGTATFSPIGGNQPWVAVLPAVFGCGAALVLDEFALILHLRDVYWAKDGRTSVDAVFIAAALIGLLLLGVTPFGIDDVAGQDHPSQQAYLVVLVVDGALVTITLLKGKIHSGLLGILVPLLPMIGAIRLARPGSPWARWRYPPGSAKERRSVERETRHHARWVRSRRLVQDAVAGRPTVPADHGDRPGVPADRDAG
jgi:hypothetical protein